MRYEDFCITTADGRKIWTVEAWDGGELLARETVYGDTYEKARDVAKFLFYGAPFVTVRPCETAPQTDETTADAETPAETETAPQRAADDATTGADSNTKTGNADSLTEAPQTSGNNAPEEIPTDSRKAPPRGAEKPHKGRKRGYHSPRPKPPRIERVFGFQGERVFVTHKMPLLYKGLPPGG